MMGLVLVEGRIKHDQNKAGAGSRDSRDVTRSQSPVTENVSEQYLCLRWAQQHRAAAEQ